MAKSYDVVVLGAGPGGYVAAVRASQLGLKTAIVEKRYWGGVCLNVGCIPSKALLRNAELVHLLQHRAAEFGIQVEGKLKFDYGEAFKRSRKVAETHVKGIHYLMKKNKVDQLEGWATFTGPNGLDVALNGGGTEQVSFKSCILAVGATTRLLPGTQRSERVVTYEEQILSDKLPKSIIIAGAGAIGVEFGYVFNSYGVDVTIVEYFDRVVPTEDEDISAELNKRFQKLGIKLMTSTRVDKIEDGKNEVKVTVTPKDGPAQTLVAEKVLQAIGFAPRIDGYGLEKTGVALTDRKAVKINTKMQTSVPHIYAIGDVTGKAMLAHVAEAMAIVAAERIANHPTVELDFDMVPRATYCQPQIASFGYSEKEAKAKGYEVNVAKFPFTANGKANGLGEPGGFVKLVSDKRYGELLGAHMIGADVTELLPELTLARAGELTVEELARNIHAHPTLSEAIKDAAHALMGHSINM